METKVSRPLKSSYARGAASDVKKLQSSGFKVSKPLESSTMSSNNGLANDGKKQTKENVAVKSTSKLNVESYGAS